MFSDSSAKLLIAAAVLLDDSNLIGRSARCAIQSVEPSSLVKMKNQPGQQLAELLSAWHKWPL